MNDQPTAHPSQYTAGSHYKLTTTALWIGLVGGSLFNIALQSVGLWFLALPFGLIALASVVGLVARAIVSRKHR
ncbi:hypothetical protein SAMN05216298_1970 [Glycomyces sambucus]|uniref:Uncharacterized protein n=1 Tax=Glycomyces sambucus TaxID=380244 RepID=A0A1G9FQY1_9ACTN|nr:hypothetical protein [Glycomyces sambucus]SDK90804.1 hypothetical protein SAMN05216298_1970 [Glycomyces sambucus]